MNQLKLILWDIRFQIKYGFYILYSILTIIYIFIILSLPASWHEKATALFIFSDPAAMGLFFMGAIILLEKSQRIPCCLASSPLSETRYILSKVISLAFISVIVGAILALAGNSNFAYAIVGTLLSSIIFTLLGIIVSTKIFSLNQFILWTVPVEVLCFVPAILHLFKFTPSWLQYYPINACMDLVSGKVPHIISIILIIALIIILFLISIKCVKKMWNTSGGDKL